MDMLDTDILLITTECLVQAVRKNKNQISLWFDLIFGRFVKVLCRHMIPYKFQSASQIYCHNQLICISENSLLLKPQVTFSDSCFCHQVFNIHRDNQHMLNIFEGLGSVMCVRRCWMN